MVRVIYPGPADRVRVPAANVVAERGEPVDVPDDIAESLLRQGWTVDNEPAPEATDAAESEKE